MFIYQVPYVTAKNFPYGAITLTSIAVHVRGESIMCIWLFLGLFIMCGVYDWQTDNLTTYPSSTTNSYAVMFLL